MYFVSAGNYAANIIVNLASLPEFLRDGILEKRMREFFGLSDTEKDEIISNALASGPGIPFGSFGRLFGAWLGVLCRISPAQRTEMLSRYLEKIAGDPAGAAAFDADALLGIFLNLPELDRSLLGAALRDALASMEPEKKRILGIMIPDSAKRAIGI